MKNEDYSKKIELFKKKEIIVNALNVIKKVLLMFAFPLELLCAQNVQEF